MSPQVLKSAVELAHDDPPSLAAAYANLGAVLKRSGKAQEVCNLYEVIIAVTKHFRVGVWFFSRFPEAARDV